MVNLRSTTTAWNQPGGYLTPRIGVPQGQPPAEVSPTQAFAMRQALNMDKDHWAIQMGKYALAAPADVIDSIAAVFPGQERGRLNAALYNSIGQPGFAAWVQNHQDGVEVGSGLLGAVGIGIGAEVAGAKLLTSGWLAATGVGRALQPTINMAANAQRAAAVATVEAAKAGQTLRWYSNLSTASGFWGKTVGAWGSNRLAFTLGTGRAALKTAVSEAAVIATMHKNEFIWGDDQTQNILNTVLGLGIGTTFGAIGARSALNRWANSDEMLLANAAYRDPAGLEELVNRAPNQALGGGAQRMPMNQPADVPVPKATATVTALMLNARRADEVGIAQSQRTTIQTEWEREAYDVLQTVTQRGAALIPESKFHVGSSSEGQALKEALDADPGAVFGASSFGRVPVGMTAKQAVEARAKEIEVALEPGNINNLNRSEVQKFSALEKETPMVLVDGQWMIPGELDGILDFNPAQLKTTMQSSGEMTWISDAVGEIRLREDGLISKDIMSLPIQEVLQTAEAQFRLLERFKRTGQTIVVPKDANFSQLDFAVEADRLGIKVDWDTAAQLGTRENAQVQSLKLKSTIVDGMKTLTSEDRLRLNLPKRTAAELVADPDGAILKNTIRMAHTPGVDLAAIQAARKDMNQVFDLVHDSKVSDAMDGGIFQFNRSRKLEGRKWLAPVIGYFDSKPLNSWTRHQLGDDLIQRKGSQLRELLQAKKAPMINNVTQAVVSHPGFNASLDVGKLADNMINGNSNSIKATASQFLTQGQRFRNTPALQAVASIRANINRVTQLFTDEALRRLNPLVNQLTSTSGANSRLLYNRYASHSKGWDIKETFDLGDGMVGFVLDEKSARNIERNHGKAITEGELLKGPEGNVIALDQLSNNFRIAFEAEDARLLDENNAVRVARGQEPRSRLKFHTTANSTNGKYFGFTIGADGKTVPGGAVIANTKDEFDRQVARLEANLPEGHRFLSNQKIEQYRDLWEQLDLDFVDPTHMAAPAKSTRGALASATVNPRAIEDALMYLKHGYEQTATGAVRGIYDGQLRSARVHMSAQARTQALRGSKDSGTRSIFEDYEDALLGKPSALSGRGAAQILQEVDNRIDQGIEVVWPAIAGTTQWIGNMMDMLGVTGAKLLGKGGKAPATFEELQTALGPYMPFTKAQELAEYRVKTIPAWRSKQVAQGLNRLGSGVILRWLEIPHSLMNLTGIITAMPGILASGTAPTIGRVAGVGVVDQAKIMAKGMARMFSRNGADWDHMVKMGYSTQEIAEFHKTFAMLDGQSAFKRFMVGDSAFDNWESLPKGKKRTQAFLRSKGVEGMASIIADTSENWSGQIAHFIGLELADHHGIVGMQARHNFANKIRQDAIANYDPLNRPEIYHSAFGSMYGLFLSYAQNYYERMFRWVEHGEWQSIGRTMAIQASLFGAMGLPGSRQLEQWLGGHEDGEDLVSQIYTRFGPAVGSVVAQGGFNQITTLFGLPAVSLQSRGDVNFRHPTLDAVNGVIKPPVGLEILSDVVNGAFGAVSAMVDPNIPNSGRYAAEILARNMPSRMLRGTISMMFAGGQEADAYGNVMSSVESEAEGAFRFLGLRSARQQAEIEAYFLNRRSQEIEAVKMDKLRQATRALVRAKQFDRLPEVFESYLNAGGAPWNYQRWIQNLVKDADGTRTQNQLLDAMRNPRMQVLASRIELMTAPY